MKLGENHLVLLLLVLLPLAAAAPVLQADFVFDDLHSIERNTALRDPANLFRFFHDPACFSANTENGMYRPVLLVSYMLNHVICGLAPGGWHLGNLLLHLAAVLVLHRILLRLLPGHRRVALGAAFLFALHPLQVEVLGHVSSRSDLLMGLLLLLSLSFYLRLAAAGRGLQWSLLIPALLLQGAAMLTKEPALLLPVAALPLMLLARPAGTGPGRALRRDALILAPGAALSGGYLLLRKWMLGLAAARLPAFAGGGDPLSGHGRDLVTQLCTQAQALGRAVELLFLPWRLSADHHFPFHRSPWAGPVLLGMVMVLLFIGLLLYLSRPRLRAVAGLVWAGTILAPVVLIPLNQPFAEHRLYAAFPGLVLALAGAWIGLSRRLSALHLPRLVPAAAALMAVLLLGGLFCRRTLVWRNPGTLWAATLATDPASFRAWSQLGQYHGDAGRTAMARRCFARAHRLYPRNRDIAVNYVEYALREAEEKGDRDLARRALEVARAACRRHPWRVNPRIKLCRAGLVLDSLDPGGKQGAQAQAAAASILSFAAPGADLFGIWAHALEQGGRIEAAAALWQWCDRLVDYSSSSLGPRVGFMLRRGDRQGALALLERVAAREGTRTDPRALDLLSRLRRGPGEGEAGRGAPHSPPSPPPGR